MRYVLKLFVRVLLRLKVSGDLNQLAATPSLVIANHDAWLDGALLGLFLPRRSCVVMSRDDMAGTASRWLGRFYRHCVLDLSEPSTVKRVARMLAAGETVIVFPQGRVTTTASAMKLYPSVATIAARSGVPIIPVTIDGLMYSRFGRVPGTFARRWLPRVSIRVHAATRLPEYADARTRVKRQRAVDHLSGVMQRAAVETRKRETLYEAFLGAAELFGRGYELVEDVRGKRETYGDLLRAILALARITSRLGPAGEIIGVMMPNISTTVSLLLGMGAAGRVPAMLNYTAGAEAIRSACVAAGVKTVITSRRFIEAGRLYPVLDALCNQRIVFVEDLCNDFGGIDKLWLVLWAWWRPRCVLQSADPAAAAVVLFTSGSEARPKGVALSHDALLANVAQMRAVIDFSPADRFLNALPMFHSYGLTACTLMPLVCGVGLYLYTSPLRYRVIPEIAYMRDCTFVFGTATFLSRYAREAHAYDFYRVRCVISGAERLSPEVAKLWLDKFGLRIFEGYGATECAPVISLNTPLAYEANTVGRFLPCVESQLVKVDGIPHGGCLHVRGPNVMLGYYFYDEPGMLRPPQSELGAGWYDTGDVVNVDAAGFVTVVGRIRRFAKIAGEMVALEMVERVASHASPYHQHAAMVDVIAESGEGTVLFTTDPQLTRATLQRSAQLLGSQDLAVARRLEHVRELPLLGSGKTDYVMLKTLVTTARPRLVEVNRKDGA
ncbi:MAG: AMP-dependent synthetase and ligase [Betaproteobacteria bacterium]|nr:AMP-dependent synthetase and ligase [Betaproteobacteria bacterium]